ncbi:MAG TPA: hypothetical protein VJ729_10355 [Nitrososphaeraceae archaeon]|nr:hypothetical protein [Nitrososphaeraceae archaeon]
MPLLEVNQSSIIRPNNIRIPEWHCIGNKINDSKERLELEELLEADAKSDKLRRIPLYFCRCVFDVDFNVDFNVDDLVASLFLFVLLCVRSRSNYIIL